MKAVVLAAGEGTRLRPLTAETPKAVLEVGGKPIIEHCFEQLVDLGVETLVVVVGYEGERIIERYGDSFAGVPITYTHQREREGMAHALLTAEAHVDGPFVLMDGDSVVRCDLKELVDRQRDPSIDGTVLVEEVSAAAAREKMVCVLNERDEIVARRQKPDDPPDPSLVAASVQTATPALFDACRRVERSPRGEYEMSDAIRIRIEADATIAAVRCDGWLVNVNTPAELRRTDRKLRDETG
ncbi:sugar phosphate nucleotidyltransferase [Halococcus salifodinae]|uniref:Nucleotidyl transferase n=1 Tax=Halococcus salifodinae DSM 8989 TaxID=1227456 RepID=M0MYG4_9EURY|nr:sugar phosphate nucleotidyltransferase [Halococcus salifodinae]EMA50636.1 Nucleotidyl transferase [Halococcus salifodinae DSM 8989]